MLTISNLVHGFELMHRAAYGVFKAVSWQGRTAIVVGSGNNRGDGFALACILKEQGLNCTVFMVSQRLSGDSRYYAENAIKEGVSILPFSPGCLQGYSIVVDCLLGTGFQGTVRDHYRAAIEAINESHAYVVSVDINSGMNGNTGEAEFAVLSDLTVAIGFVKKGQITPNAGLYIKKLVCVDIGIVLAREEGKICGADEALLSSCYPCPEWLDMNIITVNS